MSGTKEKQKESCLRCWRKSELLMPRFYDTKKTSGYLRHDCFLVEGSTPNAPDSLQFFSWVGKESWLQLDCESLPARYATYSVSHTPPVKRKEYTGQCMHGYVAEYGQLFVSFFPFLFWKWKYRSHLDPAICIVAPTPRMNWTRQFRWKRGW